MQVTREMVSEILRTLSQNQNKPLTDQAAAIIFLIEKIPEPPRDRGWPWTTPRRTPPPSPPRSDAFQRHGYVVTPPPPKPVGGFADGVEACARDIEATLLGLKPVASRENHAYNVAVGMLNQMRRDIAQRCREMATQQVEKSK